MTHKARTLHDHNNNLPNSPNTQLNTTFNTGKCSVTLHSNTSNNMQRAITKPQNNPIQEDERRNQIQFIKKGTTLLAFAPNHWLLLPDAGLRTITLIFFAPVWRQAIALPHPGIAPSMLLSKSQDSFAKRALISWITSSLGTPRARYDVA